jgi:branched-chain amino acid transport system permease protein
MSLAFLLDLLTDYSIFTVMAFGLHIVLMSGQVSLGHAALFGVGAYMSAILTVNFRVPFLLALPLGGAAGALAGWIIASLVARRLRGMYLAIATFALDEALITLGLNSEYLGGAIGFPHIPLRTNLLVLAVVNALLVFALWRFERSRFGASFRAVADDEVAAGMVGVNVGFMRVLAWVLGGFMTGLGGALHAHRVGVISPPEFGFSTSVAILLAPVIGGARTFRGTVVGAAVITFLPWLVTLTDVESRLMLYGAMYVVIMIFRPAGLIGPRQPRPAVAAGA